MLNALDGLDVVAITLASPLVTTEYGIDKGVLGIVLSMELVGMAVGSIFLGGIADQFGRRPTILGCLIVMCIGMFMATTEPGVMAQGLHNAALSMGWLQNTPTGIVHLLIWRFITGLGIGGMLAAINAVVAEYSSGYRKHMNVSIMAMGYPIGAAVGSQIAAYLLMGHGWRSVFYMGFIFAGILIPLVFVFMPETIHWVEKKRPARALEKINSTLRRMGKAPVSELLPLKQLERKETVIDIFSPLLIGITIVVTIAYFFHIMTFYFVLKWVAQIIADMGFAPSNVAQMVFWVSVGGATGGGVIGLLTLKFDLKKLTIGAMLLSVVLVNIFGRSPADLGALALICFGAGFCTNAAINGMYAIFAHAYPTHVRAVGTGFAIGVGRGGSVLAPVVAGFLFKGGVSVPIVATIMAMGSLCAAIALFFLKYRPEPPEALETEEATGIARLHESAA
jgi:MFS transporter, AAHS family, vanillate permease